MKHKMPVEEATRCSLMFALATMLVGCTVIEKIDGLEEAEEARTKCVSHIGMLKYTKAGDEAVIKSAEALYDPLATRVNAWLKELEKTLEETKKLRVEKEEFDDFQTEVDALLKYEATRLSLIAEIKEALELIRNLANLWKNAEIQVAKGLLHRAKWPSFNEIPACDKTKAK